MKKIVTLGILMICLLVAVRMTTFANAESIEEVSFVDADDVVDEKNVERGDSGIIEDIIIDHHMDVIMDVCDKITVINFGTQIATGAPESIQSNPDVIAAYLGENET